jgi:hypothetical protein
MHYSTFSRVIACTFSTDVYSSILHRYQYHDLCITTTTTVAAGVVEGDLVGVIEVEGSVIVVDCN